MIKECGVSSHNYGSSLSLGNGGDGSFGGMMEFGVGHFCVGRMLRIVAELSGVMGYGVLELLVVGIVTGANIR